MAARLWGVKINGIVHSTHVSEKDALSEAAWWLEGSNNPPQDRFGAMILVEEVQFKYWNGSNKISWDTKVITIDYFGERHDAKVASTPKKLTRDDSNPSAAAFWGKVKEIAAEARKEPQWAKAGISLNPENYEVFGKSSYKYKI